MLPMEDRVLLQNTMTGLNVDPDSIATLLSTLDETATTIEARPVANVSTAWFGGSHTGGHRLATNADMAYDAVRDELAKMVAGIRGMSQSLELFEEDVVTVTEQSSTVFQQYAAATECVSAPTFDSGQCTLPNSSED